MSWFKKRTEVRMQGTAPSFLSFGGNRFMVSEPKGIYEALKGNSPSAAVFIPGQSCLSDPRAWANALASVDYLIVMGEDSKELSKLMTALDRIVFSPVARKLSSAILVHTEAEAQALLDSVRETGYHEMLIQEGGN